MKKVNFVMFASATILLAACSEPKTEATPKAAARAQEVARPEAEAPEPSSGRLVLTPENAKVGFVGAKMIGSHEGAFHAFSGTIDYKNGDPLTATISVAIDLASVKTDNEKLDGHLKSPDFFDVEKFPKATFVSTDVTEGGDGGATHTVRGELTLHGVKKPLAIPARIDLSQKKVSVSGEFTINRKDFGIVYPGMPDNLIKDDVTIKLSIDAAIP